MSNLLTILLTLALTTAAANAEADSKPAEKKENSAAAADTLAGKLVPADAAAPTNEQTLVGGTRQTTSKALVPFAMPTLEPPAKGLDLRPLLTEYPKGADLPRLVARDDGHLYAGGRRVRLWGVNLCFGACFPEHEVADKLAARLAGFGINAVRLHHMDNRAFPDGIWEKDFSGLSPQALDRLDYLLAAFKREGIYVNLNLHVSRDFTRTGFDFPADQMPQFGKIVNIFHPRLIELQKQYARDLLTHRNAYTGLTYAEDPVIAIVEISNENSSFHILSRHGDRELNPTFEVLLNQLWIDWLRKRYADDAALRAAWQRGSIERGPEMLRGGAKPTQESIGRDWIVSQLQGAAMDVTVAEPDRGKAGIGRAIIMETCFAIGIRKITDTSWHLQLMQPGIKLEKGRFYTVRFQARADKPRNIGISIQQHGEPWRMLGLGLDIRIDETWREYEFGFIAAADEANARLGFSLGSSDVAVYLSQFSMTPGGREGLRDGESLLKEGSIRRGTRDAVDSTGRQKDFVHFLADVDTAFFGGMRNYLRDELKAQALITGSETFTTTGDYVHARHMDLVAAHAYWDHPHFPRTPWHSRDWVIRNQAMVDSPAAAHTTLASLTRDRFLRADADGPARPFCVMEYNHGMPNEAAAEGIPMIAATAALQDWDGVFLFAYNHGRDWNPGAARGYFDIQAHPLKMAQMMAGALIFRRSDIEPLPLAVLTGLPPERLYDLAAADGPWSDRIFSTESAARLGAPVEMRLFGRYGIVGHAVHPEKGTVMMRELPPEAPARYDDSGGKVGVIRSVDGRLNWSARREAGSGQFAALGARAAVFAGFGRGEPVSVGPLTIDLPKGQFAAITLHSLSDNELASGARYLITACGRMENTDQAWNEARTSVGDQWGRSPTLVEPVSCRITLQTELTDCLARLVALNPDGSPRQEVDLGAVKEHKLTLDLPTQTGTIWYLLELRPIEE